jgi:hypothetical protein
VLAPVLAPVVRALVPVAPRWERPSSVRLRLAPLS